MPMRSFSCSRRSICRRCCVASDWRSSCASTVLCTRFRLVPTAFLCASFSIRCNERRSCHAGILLKPSCGATSSELPVQMR